MDLTADGALRHQVYDRAAEPPPLRWRNGRPGHGEEIAIKPPAHFDTASSCRQRAIFGGVGRKFVQCETDGLRGCCIQTHSGAVDSDPGPDTIRKVRELGTHKIVNINSLPLIPDQQVQIGRERLDALSEPPKKIFRLTSRRLAGDCLHEAEHVLRAMTDLAHQKLNLFLVSSSLGDVLGHANEKASSIRLGSQGS